MIRFTCMLAAFFLAFNMAYAQSHPIIKGPAAKNYKPWKQQARTGTLVVRVDEKKVKGPFFKNKKPSQGQVNKAVVTSDLRIREKITGPSAKNKKPWQED